MSGRRSNLPVAALMAAGLASWSIGAFASPAATSAAAVPISIDGSGDADILASLTEWQDQLYTATQPVDLQYYERGSRDGRAQLLAGTVDFAVSGVPFTAQELADRPASAGRIIEVPLAVSSLTFVVTTPRRVGWSTETIDQACAAQADLGLVDPDTCVTRGTYTGPIRMPPENLSAFFLGLSPAYQNNRLALWDSAGIEAAMGTSSLSIQGSDNRTTFINRTEGSAANTSLMSYAKTLAPTAWALRLQENSTFPWEPIGEVFSPRTFSRYGSSTQSGLMAIASVDAATNGTPADWAGNGGAVLTTQIKRLISDFPAAGFRQVEIQNADGDWVLATKATLDAALASGTAMNTAATQKVDGAYPLTWITNLYTVAGTLTPDQANALAASIRYIVTDGQDLVVADGGTTLTATLQTKALVAANDVVEANCTASGYSVEVGGPGPLDPGTPKLQALAGLKHCVVAPVVTTTTTTTTSTTTTTTTIATTTTTTAGSATSASTIATTSTVVASSPIEPGSSVETPSVFFPNYSPTVPPYIAPSVPFDDGGATTISAEVTEPLDSTAPSTTTVDELGSSTSAPPTSAPPAGGAGTRVRGRALTALPLLVPDDGAGGYKKLGTLMLGAGTFLGGRRVVVARKRPVV